MRKISEIQSKNLKRCSTCKEMKPYSSFHKRSKSKDGLEYECKECRRKYGQEHYQKNKEKRIAESKRYRQENKEKERERHREKYSRLQYRNKRKNPQSQEQKQAHLILNKAIRQGKVIRPELCDVCKEKCDRSLRGHHEDYSKPLEVIWVCPPCHKKLHVEKFNSK